MKTVLTSIAVVSLSHEAFFVTAECKETDDAPVDWCAQYSSNPKGCDADAQCTWIGSRRGSISLSMPMSVSIPQGAPHLTGIHSSEMSESGPFHDDVVARWLKEQGAVKQDSIGSHALYRAKLDVPVEHASKDWTIKIPMYLYHYKNYKWMLYIIPENFYKTVTSAKDYRKCKSNKDLKADEIKIHYNAYSNGGAEILLHVDPGSPFTAEIKNIRMGDVKTEYELVPPGDLGKFKKKTGELGFWWAVRSGDVKLTHAFSAALETVYKKLGVRALKCSDQAYHKCGKLDQPNAAISQLFLRIFGHQQNSLYMKAEFGFDINDDNLVMDRQEFDKTVGYLHGKKWDQVMGEYNDFGATEATIKELEVKVKKANGKNSNDEKRVAKSFDDTDLGTQKIGDVMTMLWYRGDMPQCGLYVEVFQLLNEAHMDEKGVYHETDYCAKMHKVKYAVQDLVKELPLDDSRIKMPMSRMDIPSLPVVYVPPPGNYFYPSYPYSYYNSDYPRYGFYNPGLTTLLCALLIACICSLGCCGLVSFFGAVWYYFGLKKDEPMQVYTPSNV